MNSKRGFEETPSQPASGGEACGPHVYIEGLTQSQPHSHLTAPDILRQPQLSWPLAFPPWFCLFCCLIEWYNTKDKKTPIKHSYWNTDLKFTLLGSL